jgi:hypothetical protein
VTRRYKLLVLSDEGASAHEFRVSRKALWLAGIFVLCGGATIAGAGYAVAACRVPSAAAAVPVQQPALRQGLAQKASLTATRLLETPEPPKGPCGPNMILIEGSYCPAVLHKCQAQTDPEGSALHGHRCARYKQPALCLSPQRVHLRYCIDRDEYVAPGQNLPLNQQTFADARKICESAAKRVCSNFEWTFACEGEAMNPYSYGFVRDGSVCNADRSNLVSAAGELVDLRAAPGTFSRCQSEYGVRDLTGNLDEYAIDDSTGRPVRKGGYWQPGANHCRLVRPHSDPTYRGVEVGFRCCSDASLGADSLENVAAH